ncbi:hypothetical protein B0T14DRAFT_440392 [Immersiella caudata]|uniref:Peptidase M43 pregnancy-associated plasma-A domain-containing protein n=1 Tax=Immersiella caudata TaxID=314043 RepID=A0AA39WC02_9PEZI|nr:hypothetical protein B0T14DRAFT_440392 [Immersiella caudata]
MLFQSFFVGIVALPAVLAGEPRRPIKGPGRHNGTAHWHHNGTVHWHPNGTYPHPNGTYNGTLPHRQRFRCGTGPFSNDTKLPKIDGKDAFPDHKLAARAPIDIPLYFHVIASSQTPSGGWISDNTLQKQFRVIRDTFSSYGITFRWAANETTKTVNTTWSETLYKSDLEPEEDQPYSGRVLEMKKALRKGGNDLRALNIYFHPDIPEFAGYSSFVPLQKDRKDFISWDGIILNSNIMPGNPATALYVGHMAVHEIGHWLGLYHTFHGGCDGEGDHVSDTAPYFNQFSIMERCDDETRNTCVDSAGPGGEDLPDPVHNFMSYFDEPCMDHFTPGQKQRMEETWNQYRVPK